MHFLSTVPCTLCKKDFPTATVIKKKCGHGHCCPTCNDTGCTQCVDCVEDEKNEFLQIQADHKHKSDHLSLLENQLATLNVHTQSMVQQSQGVKGYYNVEQFGAAFASKVQELHGDSDLSVHLKGALANAMNALKAQLTRREDEEEKDDDAMPADEGPGELFLE